MQMNSRHLAVMSFVTLWAVALVAPRSALAVNWPLAEAAPTTLAFGAIYSDSAGVSRTHSGVDLRALSGAPVLAASAG